MIKTPFVSVDGIIELYNGEALLGVVIIERRNPPYGSALPGGFVDIGESVEHALEREMLEETTLKVNDLTLLGVYSDPARDARFHTVSVVYVCKAEGTPKAADDAKSVSVIPLEELRAIDFVFDHKRIIDDYLKTYHASIA